MALLVNVQKLFSIVLIFLGTSSSYILQRSIESSSSLFKYYIVDQWGVLHDGKKAYEGSVEAIEMLKNSDKKIIMLSNSSKRRSASVKGLAKVGFRSDLFDDVITSGEITWSILFNRSLEFLFSDLAAKNDLSERQKLKVFLIGNNDDDIEYMTTADCQISSPEEADLILARGTFAIHDGSMVLKYEKAEILMNEIKPWLERCAAKDLPMLVSNPDFYRPGSNSPMPGLIGKLYSSMLSSDGKEKVKYIGKPYATVYSACFNSFREMMGFEVPKSEVVMCGDSLDHDIAGASLAGISSVWTANGVHAKELGTEEGNGTSAPMAVMESVLKDYGSHPTYVVPNFSW